MKELGEDTYILGIRIYRNRSKNLIGFSQSLYLERCLRGSTCKISKKGLLPMQHGIHLSKRMLPKSFEEREKMAKVPYAFAIGSLMCAMLCTRPDIAYVASVTSRFHSNLRLEHWATVKNIPTYLRRTKDMVLVYGGGELRLYGFSDSNFHSDMDDRKSIYGLKFTCNGGVVTWKSFKQYPVADSTIEAEYVATSDVQRRLFGLRSS